MHENVCCNREFHLYTIIVSSRAVQTFLIWGFFRAKLYQMAVCYTVLGFRTSGIGTLLVRIYRAAGKMGMGQMKWVQSELKKTRNTSVSTSITKSGVKIFWHDNSERSISLRITLTGCLTAITNCHDKQGVGSRPVACSHSCLKPLEAHCADVVHRFGNSCLLLEIRLPPCYLVIMSCQSDERDRGVWTLQALL